jgi:predicted MarR family transcription regulator
MAKTRKDKRPIVSSAHLASDSVGELSEFEYGLIVAHNAFSRWIQRGMAAAGQAELSALEILVLHSINHRQREKRLADLCFVLNVEDSHTVNYAIKKLLRLDLIAGTRRGKEIFYSVTETGRQACGAYRKVREDCLVSAFGLLAKGPAGDGDPLNAQVGETADILRALSGLYDQAARAAASL